MMNFKSAMVMGALLWSALAHAGTLFVSVTDVNATTGAEFNSEDVAVSFTLPTGANNVTITAHLADVNPVNSLTAYLTTSLGPGESTLFTNPGIVVPAGPASDVSLFSGLSLAAGTYFAVVDGVQAEWILTTTPTITLAPGVLDNTNESVGGGNRNTSNPPAGPFTADSTEFYLYSVSGDFVPEPSTGILMLAGAVAFGLARFSRRVR